MIEPFVHSAHCEARIFCRECRTSRDFRASLFQQQAVPQSEFPCPYGFTAENFPEKPENLPLLGVVDGTAVYDLPKIWGPRFWSELHLRALAREGTNDSQWLAEFAMRIPCKECRKHWQQAVGEHPPVWTDYFRWTVDLHNVLNRLFHKPEFSREAARQAWISRADP